MPRRWSAFVVPALALLLAIPATASAAQAKGQNANAYIRTKLVSNQMGGAQQQDTDLVNGWGLVAGPSTPWWVADNGTDLSTLYDGTGAKQSLVVNVPSAPTGAVFNGGTGFSVTDGTNSGAALFIFSTEEGTILGWSPGVRLHRPRRRPSRRLTVPTSGRSTRASPSTPMPSGCTRPTSTTTAWTCSTTPSPC
jgi:hypothetical protein